MLYAPQKTRILRNKVVQDIVKDVLGKFQILEADRWTQTPISAYIGPFEAPLSTHILI